MRTRKAGVVSLYILTPEARIEVALILAPALGILWRGKKMDWLAAGSRRGHVPVALMKWDRRLDCARAKNLIQVTRVAWIMAGIPRIQFLASGSIFE